MNSKLILKPTAGMSREDWLLFRFEGLGASEVGAVLGLDDYTSSLELFHYKIGNTTRIDVESMAAFMGREQEDLIANMWQYWQPGGEEADMISNYRNERIVRRCRRINAFVINPDYPWLYASLDRVINKYDGRGEGTLECKTISRYEAQKWEAGIPPKYVTQEQTQMICGLLDWGEMALLEEALKYAVLPFEINRGIADTIIERTKKFWDNVLKARKLMAEKFDPANKYNQRRRQEIEHEIDKLAPEPDGTLVYAKYLSERYKQPNKLERRGTSQEYEHAVKMKYLDEQIEELQTEKRKHESQLKTAIGDHQILNFGQDGKLFWSQNTQGTRTFRNNVKI